MMSLNDFKKNIGKIPISTRLKIVEDISRKRIDHFKSLSYTKIDGRTEPYNHELEMLALFFVTIKESKGYRITDRQLTKWWHRSINYLRNQSYIDTEALKDDETSKILAILLFTQQMGQQRFDLLKFRYSYIYNYVDNEINMQELFLKEYNLTYDELLKIIESIYFWIKLDRQESIDYFLRRRLKKEKFKKIQFMIKDIDEFVDLHEKAPVNEPLHEFTNLNLLIKYPFIKHNNEIFLPYAPHIFLASTSSLLFDLTKKDNTIRQLVGKNILESYIKTLIYGSKVINKFNIVEEYEYKKGFRTSDFIVYSDSNILFLEVKLFNQSLSTRQFDEDSVEYNESKLADAITQVYRNINIYQNKEIKKVQLENLREFGIVLISSEYTFSKQKVYEKSLLDIKEKLNIDITMEELSSKVLIMDIESFEQILIHSADDIFEYLIDLFLDNPIVHLDVNYKEKVRSDEKMLELYELFFDKYYRKLVDEIDEYLILDD